MGSRWYSVVVDAVDPARLARWWAEVLDLRILDEEDGVAVIGTELSAEPYLTFVRVPEAKAGKNRLHLDLAPGRPGRRGGAPGRHGRPARRHRPERA